MKQFRLYNGPFVHARDDYKKTMFSFLIVFIPFLIYTVYHEGIIPYMDGKIPFNHLFYPLLFVMTPVILVFILEIFYKIIFCFKTNFKDYFKQSFACFSALFTALLFNISTPLWVLILSTIFSYILYKFLFEKVYGISTIAFAISILIVILTGKEYNLNFTNIHSGIGSYDSLITSIGGFDHLLLNGSYLVPGLISIVAFIYLILKKDAKYLISCSALISVFIGTFIISLVSGTGIWYPFYFLFSNGVLFLIFILASDFHGPASIDGQIMYGILLGLMIIVFRLISNVDITFISLLVVNTFSFALDYISELFNRKFIYPIIIVLLLGVSLLFGILL